MALNFFSEHFAVFPKFSLPINLCEQNPYYMNNNQFSPFRKHTFGVIFELLFHTKWMSQTEWFFDEEFIIKLLVYLWAASVSYLLLSLLNSTFGTSSFALDNICSLELRVKVSDRSKLDFQPKPEPKPYLRFLS